MNDTIEKQGIEELIDISHYAAANIAYIQGGGGNTSVKLSETEMAVKASGCKLSDMDTAEGYVVVDYSSIKTYFAKGITDQDTFESESSAVLQQSIIEKEGLKVMRPSVEAGFHSLLKKYVIHTHSVYSNILCCSEEGKGLAEKIFVDVDYIWLPYVDPGAWLTMAISDAIKAHGHTPDVIFMANHGVIVSADTAEEAKALHETVNNKIREALDLKDAFPTVAVEEKNGKPVSASAYVTEYFKKNDKDLSFIRVKVLYPDQLVYLNNSVYKKDGSASDIIFEDGLLTYLTSTKQAQVNEETLVAYLYVIETIAEKGLTLVSMTHEQQAFILGWESEAYRKSMLK